jgi:hypothetical protein
MEGIMSEVNSITNADKVGLHNIGSGKRNATGSTFSSYLGESESMNDIFQEASIKYKVDVELLKAIGKAESNFDAKAVSRCGAQGVMQLMPATAKSLGVTDSFDARQNIMGGAKYISELLHKYDGDVKLALAAYNAGSGNVAKYNGIPPFEETQNYVKKVMTYMQKGADTNGITVRAASSAGFVTANKSAADAPVKNNIAFLIANSVAGEDAADLISLFTYEDYLKFVDLFLKEKEEQKEEENSNGSTLQDINFNVPVMNLLKNQSLI